MYYIKRRSCGRECEWKWRRRVCSKTVRIFSLHFVYISAITHKNNKTKAMQTLVSWASDTIDNLKVNFSYSASLFFSFKGDGISENNPHPQNQQKRRQILKIDSKSWSLLFFIFPNIEKYQTLSYLVGYLLMNLSVGEGACSNLVIDSQAFV